MIKYLLQHFNQKRRKMRSIIQKVDEPSVVLVSIDNLNDFILEDGKLSVPNAVQAANNTAGFIEENIRAISKIVHVFDTHREKHIFFSMWWINAKGEHPKDYEKITYQKVLDGTWIPIFEKVWSLYYVKQLGEFTIWPIHCIEGTSGNDLFKEIANATSKHSQLHQTRPETIIKGLAERTENYGLFAAEVKDPKDRRTWTNTGLLQYIAGFDLSYWCGEERGHCVRRSLEQYIGWCQKEKPEAISKMRYLDDCISTLEFGNEYKAEVAASVQSMVNQGMIVVHRDDPIS